MNTLGVIGLGYVGLPLSVQAAQKKYRVSGYDKDTELISLINHRVSPFAGDQRFSTALKSVSKEYLVVSDNPEVVRYVDVLVIAVPTPTIGNKPDLRYVVEAANIAASVIKKGQLIILESTVNPGVTRNIFLPMLERKSGFIVGKDFYLVHCPERVDPGNKTYYVGNLNRVVGGITKNCTKKAQMFYESIIDAKVIPLNSAEEAEFVKSWENSHRNVMIALANNAAIICDAVGMDIDSVLRGLQSKVDQFGLNLAKPGIGPGGHCIPEDIHYIIQRARQEDIDTGFLLAAAELNDKMPRYAVNNFMSVIRQNSDDPAKLRFSLLGIAYKPDISDQRRSPSIEVGYELVRQGKSLKVYDPYVKEITIKGSTVSSNIEDALKDVDAIFIGTAHKTFIECLTIDSLKKNSIKYVFDGRNCLDKKMFENTGIVYVGIGRSTLNSRINSAQEINDNKINNKIVYQEYETLIQTSN
ncbi:MAG TPA: nucleotide sugar dehydrogenase [Candidatus Saccharimonadales bacterium]